MRNIILLTLLVASASVFSQPVDHKAVFADAEYYFLYQEFEEALPLYQKLLDDAPNNANFNYRVGQCLLNIPGKKVDAIPFFEKASKNVSPSYNEGSYKEEAAPENVLFQLGEAYRISGKLDKAIEAYNSFKDLLKPNDLYNYDFVQHQIQACERAKVLMNQPLGITEHNIALFNSPLHYSYSPILSADGKTLVYTVQEKFYDAIYVVNKKADNTWGDPVNITLDIAVEGEVYATSVNTNGTQLFLFKNDRGDGNIYTTRFLGGRWQKVEKLNKHINTRYWETHASITNDGKRLFFTSNRKGGVGGLDIYCSNLQPNGEWGLAVNLGKDINTAFNEESPYFLNDSESLFFASQGHNGIGGYDIFSSIKVNETRWSQPTNMGYPISTTDDDMFFFPVDQNKGLVSLLDKSSETGRRIKMVTISPYGQRDFTPISGKLFLSDNNEVQSGYYTIQLVEISSKKVLARTEPKDATGEFSFEAKPGSYIIISSGSGYQTDTISISIPENYTQSQYPVAVTLNRQGVSTGQFVSIRSIQFDYDNFELNNDAMFEAERIYNFLTKYPDIIVEVSGHTDAKGTALYNRALSQKRAETVINYLVAKGINPERLKARAAGAYENIADNLNPDGTDNPDGRKFNRRACISITNSNSKVQIEDELRVPEYLKPRIQKYSILLEPIGKQPSIDLLQSSKALLNENVREEVSKNGEKVFLMGLFDHKSEAIVLLNSCIDIGFQSATIVGVNDLSNILINSQISTSSVSGFNEKTVYTIQLTVVKSKNTQILSQFKPGEVTEFKEVDGRYRYLYGSFKGLDAAELELDKVKRLGYPDAFIVNAKRFEKNK